MSNVRLENGKLVDVEIVKLEATLTNHPNNLDVLLQLAEMYMLIGKRTKISFYVVASLRQYLSSPSSLDKGLLVANIAMRYWRAEKYSNRETLRLNISAERSEILLNVERVLMQVERMKDPNAAHRIAVQLAQVKALRGEFNDALAIYSELITVQAMDGGVEYTYIILQAAVLLKHIGQNLQSIEYLEFLIDDPPVSDGYSKMHILAFLTLVYEQSGSHYVVVKERTYEELLQAYQSELGTGSKRPQTNLKKLDSLLSKNSISESSEIWEMLALQAIDRCDYIFAMEFLKQATTKKGNKSRLYFLLSELHYMEKNMDHSLACAEKAYSLQPQSAELRNMLLMLAPEKWTERIRSAAAATANRGEDLLAASKPGAVSRVAAPTADKNRTGSPKKLGVASGGGKGEHWLSKVRSKAESAMKLVQQEGEKLITRTAAAARSPSPPLGKGKIGGGKGEKKSGKSRNQVGLSGLEELEREAQKVMKAELEAKREEERKKRERPADMPAKPVRPELDGEGRILLENICLGEATNVHLYEEDLQKLLIIRRETIEEEDRKVKQRMKEKAAQRKK